MGHCLRHVCHQGLLLRTPVWVGGDDVGVRVRFSHDGSKVASEQGRGPQVVRGCKEHIHLACTRAQHMPHCPFHMSAPGCKGLPECNTCILWLQPQCLQPPPHPLRAWAAATLARK